MTVSLDVQIAVLREHAAIATSYAAAVSHTPKLAAPANAERDALHAALETLEAIDRRFPLLPVDTSHWNVDEVGQ